MNRKNIITFIILTLFISFFYWLNEFIWVLNFIVSLWIYAIIFYVFHIIYRKIRKKEISDSKIFLEKFFFNISIFLLIISLLLWWSAYISNEFYPAKMPEFTLTNWKKIVKFQAMIHIWKKDFYEQIAKNIRNFKKENWVYFFEWVKAGTEKNMQDFNKALWVKFDQDLYKNFSKLYGVSFQDNSIFLWLENNLDFNVDISMDKIMELYNEKKIKQKNTSQEVLDANKEILEALSSLNEKELKLLIYVNQAILNRIIASENIQSSIWNQFWNQELLDVILNERNKVVANEIINSDYDKIFITYWLLHFKWILKLLQENDKNWKIIKTKNYYPIK